MIGQRVMVHNLRPGPTWIPGTIVGRNGPLSYVVQVKGEQVWKRHIEHLREMGDTPVSDIPVDETSNQSILTKHQLMRSHFLLHQKQVVQHNHLMNN